MTLKHKDNFSNILNRHRAQIKAGAFWADEIKKLHDKPAKRLELALENLPLPRAFREAAIATRGLIRIKKKANENYEEELSLLYGFAAINSFSIPYSEVLQEPGYNVIESMPGKMVEKLPFSYAELGYKRLELLNKTDIKWLVDSWGDPSAHTTLHDIHISVWQEYENRLKTEPGNSEEDFLKLIGAKGNNADIDRPKLGWPKKDYSIDWLVIAAVVLLLLMFFYL